MFLIEGLWVVWRGSRLRRQNRQHRNRLLELDRMRRKNNGRELVLNAILREATEWTSQEQQESEVRQYASTVMQPGRPVPCDIRVLKTSGFQADGFHDQPHAEFALSPSLHRPPRNLRSVRWRSHA